MTTTASRIRGSVAKILNTREIIINRGAEDGVEAGMKFAVLDPEEDEVTDPDTGEVLGVIRRPRLRVIVHRVEPRLAFARTSDARRVDVGGLGYDWEAMSRIFDRIRMPPRYEERAETLRTDEPAWDGEDGDRPVRTGDPVEQVLEGEAAS